VFRTGPAVLVGGGTTLVAFLVLTLTDSPLLSQIGWVVPLGLFFCMVTILWALPAWLVWVERRPWGRIKGTMGRLGMAHLGRWVTGHPVMALLVTGFFLAAALPGIGWIRFEQNPMALKPKGLEALDVQQVLVKAFGGGREYVLVAWSASSGETLWRGSHKVDAALAGLKQTGQVHSWTSLSRLCSYQPVHLEGMDGAGISKLFRRYGLRFEDFVHAHGFVKSLLSDPQSNEGSTAVQGRICRRLEQLPQMYGRFFICRKDGLDGIAWAQVSKKGDVDLLRATLSARLPGVIVVNPRLAVRQFLAEVGKELWTTIGLASGLVLGILFLFFRRVSSVLLVLLPMTLGLLTTAGIMGWAGVHINLFNFIVLPILIGIGLDDGIHIFRRYSEMKDIPYTLASTGRSVLVTTLTTACGFGSLLLADYHVLETMGLMTMVGVFACLFFSVMLLPAVLRLLDGPKTGS
jgi:predicted exporter